jgi:hypothetical protein
MFYRFLLLILIIGHSTLNAQETGFCYVWSEGDAPHLMECKPSTLAECSRGKQSIKPGETSFDVYTGKLFRDEETQSIHEFKKSTKQSCENDQIKSARGSELTMSSSWGYSVYSKNLKTGDKAYIYGKSVNIREQANVKSKRLFALPNFTEVKILEKSKKEESVKDLYSSFWFKITVNGKTGWVFGQFLHPDPKSKEEFIQ